ncbi:MAG: YgjV family protein [Clostridia bacterium]|nr:YgjV family protein [Clostridia bacterium]
MANFILIQLIGAIGYGTIAFSYYKQDKKDILFIQIISYIFFTVHYYLLGGLTGAICNILGLIGFMLIYLFDKYKVKSKKILTVCLIPLLIIISLATYENVFSIFPIFASVISIIAFLTNNENEIRRIGIVSAICWFIYAVIYKSYIAIAFEILLIISTIIAFIKNSKNRN